MANEIRLPDIGDFKDVPIIEILVAPGQSVQKDAPILTLESDKATMDVPAPEDGVIGEVHVKVGDKVSQGALLATYAGGAAATAGRGAAAAAAPPQRACACRPLRRPTSRPKFWCSAPVRAAIPPLSAPPTSGRRSCWSTRGATLGGVCLNVGCIPSKALLHVAKVIDEAAALASARRELRRAGDRSRRPSRLEGRRRQAPDDRPDRPCEAAQSDGRDRRRAVHLAQYDCASRRRKGARVVRFDKAIIAAGSEPIAPGFIPADPRIWDSTSALELQLHTQAHAGARRRHHRSRNGDRLSFARRRRHGDRDDGPVDAGRRPRHRRAARQAHRPGATTRSS